MGPTLARRTGKAGSPVHYCVKVEGIPLRNEQRLLWTAGTWRVPMENSTGDWLRVEVRAVSRKRRLRHSLCQEYKCMELKSREPLSVSRCKRAGICLFL